MDNTVISSESKWGYERDPGSQKLFDDAASRLKRNDGWPGPTGNDEPQLVADLALEGGGVKGIGLVGAILVLDEAGYGFRGVAGTSAGAIVASLVAALSATRPDDITDLLGYMQKIKFKKFMQKGPIHKVLSLFGNVGEFVADAAILTHRTGIYSGDYLTQWLRPILHEQLGISTFAALELGGETHPKLGDSTKCDLQRTLSTDNDASFLAGRNYRLVAHTSDITRGELVRLPWDYPIYGHTPNLEDPVDAVRASMSIPFFFRTVSFDTLPGAELQLPIPGGGSLSVHYEPGRVTLVDGGMLQNFPITAFDRIDGKPARWPTIGIKLSRLQRKYGPTKASRCAVSEAVRCIETMMNEWDAYTIDESTAARTIFVDTGEISATDFNISALDQNRLFLNGVNAASDFIIEMANNGEGHVPRTADDGLKLVARRRDAQVRVQDDARGKQ